MSKTNYTIVKELVESGKLDHLTTPEQIKVTMSAAREDERERVRKIVEKRIKEIDQVPTMTGSYRKQELKQLLNKLK